MYRRLYRPEHPRADITGMVGEHILIAEAKYQGPIASGTIIHHVNFHKWDNQPENLLRMTRLQHQRLPMWQARFILTSDLYSEFLTYWELHRDVLDPEEQLHLMLVQEQNAKERLIAQRERAKRTNADTNQ